MPTRDLNLTKSCNEYKDEIESKQLTVICINGQIQFQAKRNICDCHDLIDDLLFNGLFPATAVKPGFNNLF